jgi:hypothetical protein
MYFRRFILGTVVAVPLLAAMAGAAHAQTVSADAAKAFIQQSGQQLESIRRPISCANWSTRSSPSIRSAITYLAVT